MSRPASLGAVIGAMRRLAVAVVGTAVVLLGIVMIVVPGPATLVIPGGLAILATEFLWARRLLGCLRLQAVTLMGRVRRSHVPRS
jgi:uncharacterized protein (TIGR02611 family)